MHIYKNLLQELNTRTYYKNLLQELITIKMNNLVLDSKDELISISSNGEYETPLMHYVKKGDVEMIDLLIKKGTELHQEDQYFRSALTIAIDTSVKNYEIIELLIINGCKYDVDYYMLNVDITLVKLLLKYRGKDLLHETNQYGETLLYAMCYKYDDIKFLLENGADVDVINNYEQSPLDNLLKFTDSDDIETVKLFIKYSKNPKKLINIGTVHNICNNIEIFNLLIEYVDDINIHLENVINVLCKTPLETNKLEIFTVIVNRPEYNDYHTYNGFDNYYRYLENVIETDIATELEIQKFDVLNNCQVTSKSKSSHKC